MGKRGIRRILFLFAIMFFFLISVDALEYSSYSVGEEVGYDPVKGAFCSRGDTCYRWHVVNDSSASDKYVSLMLNQNLGEKTLLKDKNSIHSNTPSTTVASDYLISLTNTWKYQGRLISQREIFSILGITSLSSSSINPTDNTKWLFTEKEDDTFWTGIEDGKSSWVINTSLFKTPLVYNESYVTYYVRPVIDIEKREITGKKLLTTSDNINIIASPNTANKISRVEAFELRELDKEYKTIKSVFSDKEKIKIFSLHLYDSNNELIESSEEVTIHINLNHQFSGNHMDLWYVDENNQKHEMEYELKDDILIFKTDHFSNYVLTEGDNLELSEAITTALRIFKMGFILGLIILILGVMILIQSYIQLKENTKKKKENKKSRRNNGT